MNTPRIALLVHGSGCGPDDSAPRQCESTLMHTAAWLPGGTCEEVCAADLSEVIYYRDHGYAHGACP